MSGSPYLSSKMNNLDFFFFWKTSKSKYFYISITFFQFIISGSRSPSNSTPNQEEQLAKNQRGNSRGKFHFIMSDFGVGTWFMIQISMYRKRGYFFNFGFYWLWTEKFPAGRKHILLFYYWTGTWFKIFRAFLCTLNLTLVDPCYNCYMYLLYIHMYLW